MPAYVINDMEVLDPQLLDEYKKLSPQTVLQYGGKFLARGGRTEKLEGDWLPRRLVILEFPSVEQARAYSGEAIESAHRGAVEESCRPDRGKPPGIS